MSKSNVKEWIENKKEEYGEPEAILIQTNQDDPWEDPEVELFEFQETNKALELLDKEFDSGFGGENGPRFFVWFKEYVMGKSIYDGSEGTFLVPRDPQKDSDLYPVGGL